MNFSLPNVDGRTISLDNYPDAKGFIIVFTCNHCPYAVAYELRLKEIHDRFAGRGFPLIAISSNDVTKYPQDSFDLMKVRAEQRGFQFPYLYDESQEVAHAYGAVKTPHVFVTVKDSDNWEVKYSGSIDDNYQNAKAVRERYLDDAVEALLAGEEVAVKETLPVGCTVKWR